MQETVLVRFCRKDGRHLEHPRVWITLNQPHLNGCAPQNKLTCTNRMARV
ncbi:MAG: zinc-finger domain-containing protein [Deltaproteobacteria bacterium]|nr:zinc-finger domain-containing protein [Deltaproteobacteria bacterium]